MINHVVEKDLDHQHGYCDNIKCNRRSVGRVSAMSHNDEIEDHNPSLYTFDTIYNENIRDLLTKNETQKLEVKQNPDTGFYVNALSTFVVKSPQEMIELMERGLKLKRFRRFG